MSGAGRLLLMRHPPVNVPAGVCYGQSDVPLLDGWEQGLLEQLDAMHRVGRILSSPLSRCREPAQWLSEHLSVPIDQDHRLMELNFGAWEGRRWESFDGPESRAWADDFVQRAPPGGESFRTLAGRVHAALPDAPDSDCLIVTHGGPIRALLAMAAGDSLADAFRRDVPHAELITLPTERFR